MGKNEMVRRKVMPETEDVARKSGTRKARRKKKRREAEPEAPAPEQETPEPEVAEPIDKTPGETESLIQRIMWVRARVTRLGKDATVRTGTRDSDQYKAISHDKVTAFIRPKMVQAGIFHSVDCASADDHETGAVTGKGRKIVQHRASFVVTFINAYNPNDKISVRQRAYADDYGDKAPGKATSYAAKYAILKMFMIETGQDDEARIEDDDPGSGGGRAAEIGDDENMMANLYAKAEEFFGEDAPMFLKQMAARRFFKDSYSQIPQARYGEALQSLKTAYDHLQSQRGNDE